MGIAGCGVLMDLPHLGGDAHQWHTPIFENTLPYEAPEQDGPSPVHFNVLMANKAIDWMRMQHAVAPQKPFFAYYATGGTHAPHHAPKEWIDKFKGQFDKGWDRVREETLARHSNRSQEQVNKDIDRDKILSAEEALEYGLIDQVLTSRKTLPALVK